MPPLSFQARALYPDGGAATNFEADGATRVAGVGAKAAPYHGVTFHKKRGKYQAQIGFMVRRRERARARAAAGGRRERARRGGRETHTRPPTHTRPISTHPPHHSRRGRS